MTYQTILVAIDDSPISYAAAEHALSLAQKYSSKVVLLSVIAVDPFVGVDFYAVAPSITDFFMQAEANAKIRLEEMQQTFARDGVNVEAKIFHGTQTAEGIITVATDVNADLIVIGSHGRTGLKKIVLGSVAQGVLSTSHIPVLIVKQ